MLNIEKLKQLLSDGERHDLAGGKYTIIQPTKDEDIDIYRAKEIGVVAWIMAGTDKLKFMSDKDKLESYEAEEKEEIIAAIKAFIDGDTTPNAAEPQTVPIDETGPLNKRIAELEGKIGEMEGKYENLKAERNERFTELVEARGQIAVYERLLPGGYTHLSK